MATKRKRYSGGDTPDKQLTPEERKALTEQVLAGTFKTEPAEQQTPDPVVKTASKPPKAKRAALKKPRAKSAKPDVPKWKQNQKILYVGLEAHRNAKRNAVLQDFDSMRQYIEHLIEQDTKK